MARVFEDQSNVEALDDVLTPIASLHQILDDSRLVPSPELYGVAKVGAKKEGERSRSLRSPRSFQRRANAAKPKAD